MNAYDYLMACGFWQWVGTIIIVWIVADTFTTGVVSIVRHLTRDRSKS